MRRAEYDPEARALYIYLKDFEHSHRTTEFEYDGGIYMDWDEEGQLLGIEVLLLEPLKVLDNG